MRHVVTTTSILGLAAIGLLSGCPDRTISEVNPQQGRVEYKDIPVTVNRNIDILFVIDDSGSMADKQTNLRNNFGNFINVLATIPGGLPDLHIGVVSSDFGSQTAEGAGPNISGCSGDGKGGDLQLGQAGSAVMGKYISDIQASGGGTRTKNYTGDLGTVFGQMATLGTNGCGFEQHLAAMKGALNNNTANAGFVRPDAFLAVIFIADEDDCSVQKSTFFAPESPSMGPLQSFRCNRFGHTCLVGGATEAAMNQVGTKDQCGPNESSQFLTKVGDYVTFLKGLKADPSKLIVAGILGTTAPYQVELRAPQGSTTAIPSVAHSCSYQGAMGVEVADPPTRIKYFLDQFPNRSTFTTICQQDQSDGLQLIAQLLKTALGDPCIEGQLADVDPNTAGPQYDCSVSDVTNYLKPSQTETVIPPCSSGSKPCWQIETDVANCPGPPGTTGRNFVLKIERTTTPPPDTHVIAYCVTEAE